MAKFCPECGTPLPSQDHKFCPECGFKLDGISQIDEKKDEKLDTTKKTPFIYDLGERFEQVVEAIFQGRGFKTIRRQRLKGKSGTINEIDVLAQKGPQKIAVECKNLSSPVGQSLVRDFIQKLEELDISKGYFASNSELTSGASRLAEQKTLRAHAV